MNTAGGGVAVLDDASVVRFRHIGGKCNTQHAHGHAKQHALQVRKMIADIDKDDSGTIDFEEFLQMMTAKMVRNSTHPPLVLRGGISAGRPGGSVAVGLESRMRRVLFARH